MPPADLNALPLGDLYLALRPRGVRRLLELARDEDLGPERRDLASDTLAPAGAAFRVVPREPGVLAGLAVIGDLIEVYAAGVSLKLQKTDGDSFGAGEPVAEVSGDAADLLRLERPMLNLLSRLSGVATLTAAFVSRIEGTGAAIYDTRKTTPGLRALEKYAVRCGGGRSHRLGLDDAAMFKDNHLAGTPLDALAETLASAARRAKDAGAAFVEVEVDSLDQFDRVLTIEPGLIDFVLLDNMSPGRLREAVRRRDEVSSPIRLEASGGVTLDSAREIAETGVERISAGALTHSAKPIDFGLDAM
jgi:nicotinate-nucleotide pyrophosphorylase (carboxylating)